jgi:hypothetical protein
MEFQKATDKTRNKKLIEPVNHINDEKMIPKTLNNIKPIPIKF